MGIRDRGSCIRMAEFLPTLAGQSFILVTLDGNTEVTYLFSGGRYLMSSRSRILEPRGTTAVMGTVLGHVSTMQQFSQGQKNTCLLYTSYQELYDCSKCKSRLFCIRYRQN